MWDLNDSPDQRRDDESEGCSSQKTSFDGDDDKGKRVGSVSNSSSSAVVIEDGSDDDQVDGDRGKIKRHDSKLFGFSFTESDPQPVTHQFFPVDESEMGATSGGAVVGGTDNTASTFPRAHWVGVKFCQSDSLSPGKSVEVSQPIKKSRRGPRSRSSQYRGVTFYRRTGRWESHIWLVSSMDLLFCAFYFWKLGKFTIFVFWNFVVLNAGIVESKFIWVRPFMYFVIVVFFFSIQKWVIFFFDC